MALTVIQRPDANLYVNDPPEYQEQPYYYSRWSAAFLPLVYKISNTKFPTNEEDGVDVYTTVTNRQGYARLNLVTSYETYIVGEKLTVSGSVYTGVYEIREVGTNYVTLDVAFTVTDTGTVVRYYENYSTLIKLYAGVPEGHPFYATDPMSYIGTYSIAPNLQNVAIIDIADLVKQKISQNNDISGTGRPNDLNAWTSFYIDFAETYDVYENRIPSTFISNYTVDNLQGITPISITNPDFTSNLNGWTQVKGVGNNNWIWDSGSAKYPSTAVESYSKNLYQEINLKKSVPYKLILNYEIDNVPDAGGAINIFASNSLNPKRADAIYSKQQNVTDLSETKTIYFTISADIKYIIIQAWTSNKNVVVKVHSINIEEVGLNYDVAYIFASNSTRQFYDTITKKRSIYGGNMAEYVMNYNEQGILGKFLTRFEKPLLFPNNYFDISTILPQSTIDIPFTEDGLLYRVRTLDANGVELNVTDTEIVNNGDGVYRLRLDNKIGSGVKGDLQLIRTTTTPQKTDMYIKSTNGDVYWSNDDNSFEDDTIADYDIYAVDVYDYGKAIISAWDSISGTYYRAFYKIDNGQFTLIDTDTNATNYFYKTLKAFDENNFVAISVGVGLTPTENQFIGYYKNGFRRVSLSGYEVTYIDAASITEIYIQGRPTTQPAAGILKYNGSSIENWYQFPFQSNVNGIKTLKVAFGYVFMVFDKSDSTTWLAKINTSTKAYQEYSLPSNGYIGIDFISENEGYFITADIPAEIYKFENGAATLYTGIDALRTAAGDTTQYTNIEHIGEGIVVATSEKRGYKYIGEWIDMGELDASATLTIYSGLFKYKTETFKISEQHPFEIDSECSKYNIYLSWINRLGNWEYFKFTERKTYEKNVENTLVRRNIFDAFPDKFTSETQDDKIRIESVDKVTVRSQYMTRERLDIVTEIIESIRVQQWLSNTEKITVIVDTDSISKYTDGDKLFAIEFDIIYPDNIIQNQ
jgi:hypothetical protein